VIGTTSGSPSSSAPSDLADVAERLMGEFGDRIDLLTISTVVLAACHDLRGSGGAARTVGLEALARGRLLALISVPEQRTAVTRHRRRR
jgi:hypothetical protein